jgi:hypothetical protein
MVRIALLLGILAPVHVAAQTMHDHRAMHDNHMSAPPPGQSVPVQPGQSAFAAIQEIVAILEADPATDWSKVNIEALRQHLTDMDNVTLRAETKAEPADGGMRFDVTGDGPVRDSVRRMILAHAAAMNGAGDWRFEASETAGGAALTVRVPANDMAKLQGLGFIGVVTRGMHHQVHHLAIARGGHPHNR